MRLLLLSTILLFIVCVPAIAQQSNVPQYSHLTITMTMDGAHCPCWLEPGTEISCCPEYSVSLNENGTVIYNGGRGAKVRGERVHSISVSAVRELVADFFRIDFFSREDRYEVKKFSNGGYETIDHAYASTISIDIDGKKKSVYLFYNVPKELSDLQRKLFDTLQIASYVGRA
jgi:hypothetical protein